LASGSYVSGRFNPKREQGLHHFQRLWLDDMSPSDATGIHHPRSG
jgi:hypothetical protein